MKANEFRSLIESAANVLAEGFEGETRTYEIKASPETFDAFERFLSHVEWCSGVGHSTYVAMSIDGDGADRFKVVSPNVRDSHPGEKNITSRTTSVEIA